MAVKLLFSYEKEVVNLVSVERELWNKKQFDTFSKQNNPGERRNVGTKVVKSCLIIVNEYYNFKI